MGACVRSIACEAIQQRTSSRMQGHLINSWEVTYTNRNVFCAHDTANGIYGGVKTIIFRRRHYAVTLTIFQCIFIAGVNIISTCRINVIDGQYMLLRLKISTYRYILGGHHKATVYNLNGDTRCGSHHIVAESVAGIGLNREINPSVICGGSIGGGTECVSIIINHTDGDGTASYLVDGDVVFVGLPLGIQNLIVVRHSSRLFRIPADEGVAFFTRSIHRVNSLSIDVISCRKHFITIHVCNSVWCFECRERNG